MISTLLIDMYAKGGALEETSSTVAAGNTLSEAYCNNYQGEEEEAFHLFIALLNCSMNV